MDVLLVEDESKLATLLQRALRERGHEVEIATRGDVGLQLALRQHWDAVVLDVQLPGIDGLEVCRRMREAGKETAVLMLTAKSSIDERVEGLDAGADDYLGKPFAIRELDARLRALGRRGGRPLSDGGSRGGSGDGAAAMRRPATGEPPRRAPLLEVEKLESGDLVLDVGAMTAWRGDAEVPLRPKEAAILEVLLRNAGQVVSRHTIVEHAWNGEIDTSSNVLDVHMRRLRTLVDRPFGRNSIETLRGVGYRLRGEK